MVSVSATRDDEKVVLTGSVARWITERAVAEGRSEAEVVEEALAVRWGQEFGDAYRELWEAGAGLDEAEVAELVDAEVYRPRQEQRRRTG